MFVKYVNIVLIMFVMKLLSNIVYVLHCATLVNLLPMFNPELNKEIVGEILPIYIFTYLFTFPSMAYYMSKQAMILQYVFALIIVLNVTDEIYNLYYDYYLSIVICQCLLLFYVIITDNLDRCSRILTVIACILEGLIYLKYEK